MITLSYQGAGYYNVYFPSKMIMLHESEIEAMQNTVLNHQEEYGTRDELEKKMSEYGEANILLTEELSDLKFELRTSVESIGTHVGNIEELMDEPETEPHHLIRELEAIKKILYEIGE